MLKIIAGRYKGRALNVPQENPELRPTLGRSRQVIFDLLGPFYFQKKRHVLDGFSGTGALGLEALSRGAAHVIFVEKDPASAQMLRKTIDQWKEQECTSIIEGDFFAKMEIREAIDLVLLDPPYQKKLMRRLFMTLSQAPWVTQETLIVLETERKERERPSPDWSVLKHRIIGPAQILMLTRIPKALSQEPVFEGN